MKGEKMRRQYKATMTFTADSDWKGRYEWIGLFTREGDTFTITDWFVFEEAYFYLEDMKERMEEGLVELLIDAEHVHNLAFRFELVKKLPSID